MPSASASAGRLSNAWTLNLPVRWEPSPALSRATRERRTLTAVPEPPAPRPEPPAPRPEPPAPRPEPPAPRPEPRTVPVEAGPAAPSAAMPADAAPDAVRSARAPDGPETTVRGAAERDPPGAPRPLREAPELVAGARGVGAPLEGGTAAGPVS